MRVLMLSRYGRMGASSRYRTHQYVPYLRDHGFDVTVSPLLDDGYLPDRYAGKRRLSLDIAQSYVRRAVTMIGAGRFDLVWLEKEALPWLPGWIEATMMHSCPPFVVDYDDAIFHHYDQHERRAVRTLLGRKIDRVMREAALVVVGNQYLARRAHEAGARSVEILPTAVDLERYPRGSPPQHTAFTVGWIGTPMTARYLEAVRPALHELYRDGRTRMIAIGAGALDWPEVPVDVRPWSEATEVAYLQELDVGIMPLPDTPYELGKCGLKLVQYMAAGRPVVASPVGVNRELVTDGVNGFQATTPGEWLAVLRKLRENPGLRQQMGEAGRLLIEQRYCLQVTAPKLAQLLSEVARMGQPCN